MIMVLIYSVPFTLEARRLHWYIWLYFSHLFFERSNTQIHVRCFRAPVEPKNRGNGKKKSKQLNRLASECCSLATDWVFATNFLFLYHCRVHDWTNQLAWLYRLIQFVCHGAHTHKHTHTLYLNDLARQWIWAYSTVCLLRRFGSLALYTVHTFTCYTLLHL